MIRIRKIATLALVNVAITLVFLECFLQVIFFVGWDAEKNHKSTSFFVQKIYWFIKPHTSWEEYFVINHANGAELVYGNLHQPHASRGWGMIPAAHRPGITINQQGYRALYDYTPQSNKYQVLIVGDSFTFGDDIDDKHTWPQLLQEKNKQLNILNMGGSGYGTDQMLITLQEEIKSYHPNLVIAAFIDDDLKRSALPFRDYKKPQFVLKKNQLELISTPTGSTQQTLEEISRKNHYSYGRIQTVNLFHYLTTNLTLMESEPNPNEIAALNTAIFEKMQSVAAENNAEFMLIYLPTGDELAYPFFKSAGEIFFEHYSAAHGGDYMNPRQDFLIAPFKKTDGHYQANENTLLSQLVMEKILTLGSWREKYAL